MYHVSHDTPYSPRVPRPRKELYDELRKNQGEPEEESVPIPMTDMKYALKHLKSPKSVNFCKNLTILITFLGK